MSVLNEKLTNYLSVTLYIYKSRARLLSRGGCGVRVNAAGRYDNYQIAAKDRRTDCLESVPAN